MSFVQLVAQAQNKAFTGRVTKLLDNFGFVDDDVFFQLSVVRGGNVKLGDNVYVDCNYSEHLPFKWNATSVQVLEPQSQSYAPQKSVMGGIEPVNDPRKASGFYRDDRKNESEPVFQQSRFVSEYNQPDMNKLGQAMNQLPVQSNYQASVSTYGGKVERDFKPSPFGDQITYTSTPGSAFVTTQIQPQFAVDPAFTSQPVISPINRPAVNNNSNKGSRWEPRNESNFKKNDGPDGRANRQDNHDRNQRDSRGERDQFGRDKFGRDRPERQNRFERKQTPEKTNRSTESPASNVGSTTTSRPRYRSSDNILRYEVLKKEILAAEVKERYGDRIHIPSDFECLMVNDHLDLNIQSIPKPIKYKFKDVKKEKSSSAKKSVKKESPENSSEKNGDVKEEPRANGDESMDVEDSKGQSPQASTEAVEEPKVEVKSESTESNTETKPESDILVDTGSDQTPKTENEPKKDSKPNADAKSKSSEKPKERPKMPKYGVKVVLLSLPSLTELYEEVCGYDFIKQVTRVHNTYFNRLVSFVSFKNPNNGYSLLGGKYNVTEDGLISGTNQPDLVATARRTVKQQTGIDLSSCSKWINLATFVYSQGQSLSDEREYSVIFMPDVWSLLDKCDNGQSNLPAQISSQEQMNASETKSESGSNSESLKVEGGAHVDQPEVAAMDTTANDGEVPNVDMNSSTLSLVEPSPVNSSLDGAVASAAQQLLERINDLKVTELKAELDARSVSYTPRAKKADLVVLLTDSLKQEQVNNSSFTIDDGNTFTTETGDVVAQDTTLDMPENLPTGETAVWDESGSQTSVEPSTALAGETPVAKGIKRKVESPNVTMETAAKKAASEQQSPKVAADGVIEASGEISLLTLSIYQALNHHKNDHFELSLTSEIIREAMVKHFTEYCLSCLIANHAKGGKSSTSDEDRRKGVEPTYVNLAFAYFDESSCGYMLADDLLQNVLNCGYKVSKRAWSSLTSSSERINYRHFEVPGDNVTLPAKKTPNPLQVESSESSSDSAPVFSLDGVIYDGANLVAQSHKYTKTLSDIQVMTDQLATQTKQLKELESKQKKMTAAIEKQNDEMCSLKRERDILKTKNDELRKILEVTAANLGEALKKSE